jgi:predicted nucleic acid-binding Zn ribbon protein
MPPLVCPVCSAETSQGAYACHRCGFSYSHERSKPYFRRLLWACLAACVVAAVVNVLGLAAAGRLTLVSAIGLLLLHALPVQYYLSRLRGKLAYFATGVYVQPKRYGWVATDFFVLFVVGMSLFLGPARLL